MPPLTLTEAIEHLKKVKGLSRRQIAKNAATPTGARRDNTKRRFNPKTHVMHQGRAIPKNTATLRREDRHEKNKLARQHRGGLSVGDFKAVGGEAGFDPETNKLKPEAIAELEKRRRTSIYNRWKLQPGVIANIKKREGRAIGRAQTAASDVAQARRDPLDDRFFTEVPLSTQGRSTGVSSAPAAAVMAHQARQLGRQPTQQELAAGRTFIFSGPRDRLTAAAGDVNAARRDLAQASLDEAGLRVLSGAPTNEQPTAGAVRRAGEIQQRLGFSPIEGRTRTPLNEQQQARFDEIGAAQAEGGISVVEQQQRREQEAALAASQAALQTPASEGAVAKAALDRANAAKAIREIDELDRKPRVQSRDAYAGIVDTYARAGIPGKNDAGYVTFHHAQSMVGYLSRFDMQPEVYRARIREAVQAGPRAVSAFLAAEHPVLFALADGMSDSEGNELRPPNEEARQFIRRMRIQMARGAMPTEGS